MATIGVNVEATVEGTVLVIRVDLTQDHGPSASGKTTCVASTHGTQTVSTSAGPVLVGLNVNRKLKG